MVLDFHCKPPLLLSVALSLRCLLLDLVLGLTLFKEWTRMVMGIFIKHGSALIMCIEWILDGIQWEHMFMTTCKLQVIDGGIACFLSLI